VNVHQQTIQWHGRLNQFSTQQRTWSTPHKDQNWRDEKNNKHDKINFKLDQRALAWIQASTMQWIASRLLTLLHVDATGPCVRVHRVGKPAPLPLLLQDTQAAAGQLFSTTAHTQRRIFCSCVNPRFPVLWMKLQVFCVLLPKYSKQAPIAVAHTGAPALHGKQQVTHIQTATLLRGGVVCWNNWRKVHLRSSPGPSSLPSLTPGGFPVRS
jgi:hypothetical protein